MDCLPHFARRHITATRIRRHTTCKKKGHEAVVWFCTGLVEDISYGESQDQPADEPPLEARVHTFAARTRAFDVDANQIIRRERHPAALPACEAERTRTDAPVNSLEACCASAAPATARTKTMQRMDERMVGLCKGTWSLIINPPCVWAYGLIGACIG